MKYIYRLLAFSFMLMFLACNDKSETSNKMLLSPDKLVFSELGGKTLVKFSSSTSWKATSNQDWVVIDPPAGVAGENIIIEISTSEQKEGDAEIAEVIFEALDGTISSKLTLTRGVIKPGRLLDSLSLVQFYKATGGERWKAKWNLYEPMDTWIGGDGETNTSVKLERVDGEVRVVELFAISNNLVGSLPDELANLTALRYFSIERNEVEGDHIPEYFAEIETLELLNLAENKFTGSIPSELFELPRLQFLVLHQNQFSGELPQNIGNCTSLEFLSLSTNNFSGELPASLSKLVKILELWLDGNNFEGEIPATLFDDMAKLKFIALAGNGEFNELEKSYDGIGVDVFPLYEYEKGGFTGPSPNFSNKPNLEKVFLHKNNFTTGPKFENCPKLEILTFGNNPLITSIDPSITAHNTLGILYIEECAITSIPEFTGTGGEGLRFLKAHRNKITSLPASFGSLIKLEECVMHDNQIDAIPIGVVNWKSLRFLIFDYNQLTALPDGIWTLSSLMTLRLAGNDITGELPTDFKANINLQNINLSYNQLYGSLAGLATIKTAHEIILSYNRFTTISDNLGEFNNLVTLQLNNNLITGNVPGSLGDIGIGLKTLTLNGNNFVGEVPRKLYEHTNWESWSPTKNILPQLGGVLVLQP